MVTVSGSGIGIGTEIEITVCQGLEIQFTITENRNGKMEIQNGFLIKCVNSSVFGCVNRCCDVRDE